ncbi:unnamed protein product [Brassica rapa subsp. narinosa]|uniref:(rape) hypothetical protein n=1 Tax=Brassica napus TaxID=3708 RepID=A0A816TCX4_BRANA|nr:unnamed protein product [Brassica napus]
MNNLKYGFYITLNRNYSKLGVSLKSVAPSLYVPAAIPPEINFFHVSRIPREEAKVFELSKFWKVMGYDTAIKAAPLQLKNFHPPRLLEDGSIKVEAGRL